MQGLDQPQVQLFIEVVGFQRGAQPQQGLIEVGQRGGVTGQPLEQELPLSIQARPGFMHPVFELALARRAYPGHELARPPQRQGILHLLVGRQRQGDVPQRLPRHPPGLADQVFEGPHIYPYPAAVEAHPVAFHQDYRGVGQLAAQFRQRIPQVTPGQVFGFVRPERQNQTGPPNEIVLAGQVEQQRARQSPADVNGRFSGEDSGGA